MDITTQWDTLDKPTHIAHPLNFIFEVATTSKDIKNEVVRFLHKNGRTMAIYRVRYMYLEFLNPFIRQDNDRIYNLGIHYNIEDLILANIEDLVLDVKK